jgi:hypothetical protein
MSIDPLDKKGCLMPTAELARIEVLVMAARHEIVGLRPTDYRLRWAILCDLNDLLKVLRSSSASGAATHLDAESPAPVLCPPPRTPSSRVT